VHLGPPPAVGRLATAFGWAVAEAVLWPLMPEAVLVPLGVAVPAEWWRLALASMLGSSIGGAAGHALGRRGGSAWLLGHLPLVRPAMVGAADRWLAEEGARGVLHQPLSGVPFKVFALRAGAAGVPPAPFLAWAAGGRGARFLAVCGGAALAGSMLRGPVRDHPRLLLGTWSVVFGIGLGRTVAAWERRGRAGSPAA
jgi:1-acyl-sn-glycerol-3-phosphate acyltransferase